MDALNLYTDNFSTCGKLKAAAKKLFFKGKSNGPNSVFISLCAGLGQLQFSYNVNKKAAETACVLSGIGTLEWAIGQKKKGLIKNIIAGPNIAILPTGDGDALANSQVNKIIVPSLWVKDMYAMLKPELRDKIYIWSAGVDLPELSKGSKIYDFIIYNKLPKSDLTAEIKNHLNDLKLKYKEIVYGDFLQTDYFKLLEQGKFLIYLSQSESQGLAMFEAWARNVSVLAFEPENFEYQGVHIQGKTSAPYMTEQAGTTFKDFNNFKEVLPRFMSGSYQPYAYIQNNFTHKLCSQKYLDIIHA